MDFQLNREQKMLLSELDSFLKKEIEPIVDEGEHNKIFRDPEVLKSWLKKLEPFGAISSRIPEKYGGMDLDHITCGLISQKLAEYWGSLWGVCMIVTAGGRVIAEIENEAIKEKYLPGICAGDLVPCFCITEPDVGSNPTEISTTIEKVDGGYLINGSKTWISNGSVSDLAVVIATTDKTKGPMGLGVILVDRRESNYTHRELNKLGARAFPTSELFFDNVLIPEENLIVQPGGGLKTIGRAFELARSMMACGSVGGSEAALKLAVDYAKNRTQWGKKIGEHQLIQKMIFDMRVRTEASALLAYRALSMMDQGIRCDIESSMAKAYATESGIKTTKECIQIMGAYGLSEDCPAERYYRDASCMTIPDGTTQIQQLIVGRGTTGLSAFF